ncbi:MAG: tRNA dihydrouridine synthase [Draconibacterium sp.]
MNNELQPHPVCYLAPLQGFTDFVYRQVYAQVFSGIDAFFIPYISVKNNEILRKYEKEVLPVNNPQTRVIPQVLAASANEMLFLTNYLSTLGYTEINLNLGCPYPMVTKRGMGSGLLPFPEKIEHILASFFKNSNLKLSVKMRAGLVSANEIEKVIPVLNQFPLSEVIVHPRVAKQLYAGDIIESAFAFATSALKHRLVYNGDVNLADDYRRIRQKFTGINHVMMGRGVLMNPFLPAEIKNQHFTETKKREKLIEFHQLMFDAYLKVMDNPGNALNKMKQFWIYFCHNFAEPKKCLKKIEKSNGLTAFQTVANMIFHGNLS